jgi:DNA-binding GntR family transcriptional regulator
MKLASRIANDLEAQLAGNSIPFPLTMDGISNHYGVSYTPIREALSGLIENGLLRKKSNGRLEAVARRTKKKTKVSAFHQELVEDPVTLITEELVKVSLSGKETFIREQATALKHGLTRSALREVLQRLAGEGLILHIPRRGWLVKPFRQEDLQAFLEVREAMELKALELARSKLTSSEAKVKLRQIKSSNKIYQNGKVRVIIDNSLHQYLIELAANPYIDDFFQRHGKYYSILFKWEGGDEQAGIQAVRQHHAIIDALLKEDWKVAAKELSVHLHTNHPVLQEINSSS